LRRQGKQQPSEHRLGFVDQAALELLRATGRGQLMQCVWVYEHPVHHQGIERFHRNFTATMFMRLVERSPLPFGRPRWIRPVGPPSPIRVAEHPRPREELLSWADELAELPIDPVKGPGWHLAVQPFSDGSTAVSILASHVIGDGAGGLMAIFDAISGNTRDFGYEPPGARSWRQAIVSDLRQAVRDLPVTGRMAVKAAKLLRQKSQEFVPACDADGPVGVEQYVAVPSVVIFVDIADWDGRAEALGGNSYSLLAGFAAKLGEYLGRRRTSDGTVSLMIAINMREGLDDERALAMAFANASVDPTKVTTDLTESRTAVREAREKAKTEPDPTMELLALIPWLTRSAVKGMADLMFGYSEDLPVSCSNLGDLPSDLARVDGTAAEYVFIRALDTDVTLGELQRSHGQLVVVSGRINGKVSISVEAYQLGAENSKTRLRELVEQTLAEFGLTGVVE
jgi:hypothetical protein